MVPTKIHKNTPRTCQLCFDVLMSWRRPNSGIYARGLLYLQSMASGLTHDGTGIRVRLSTFAGHTNMLPHFFGRLVISGDLSSHPGVIFPCFLPTLPEGEDFDQQGTFGRKLGELLQRNQEMIKIMEAEISAEKNIPRCRNRLIQRHYVILLLFWGGAGARAPFYLHTVSYFVILSCADSCGQCILAFFSAYGVLLYDVS